MTDTYNNFLKQYNSKGSQKADGYSESHFEGMTVDEKKEAFDLLKTELIAPGVADWLFYLDPIQAEMVLLAYINKDAKNKSGIHRVFYQLYIKTTENKYQNSLIDNYIQYLDWEKDEAIWLINGSKPEKNIASAFYKNVIMTEKNKDALSSAADFFLRLNGLPCKAKEEKLEFFRIRKLLESAVVDDKVNGILSVEKFQVT